MYMVVAGKYRDLYDERRQVNSFVEAVKFVARVIGADARYVGFWDGRIHIRSASGEGVIERSSRNM